jgi:hypothetical protein
MITVKNVLTLGVAAALSLSLAGCPKSTDRTDWFTQVFTDGNDLDGLQLNFTPDDGPNGYTQVNSVVSDFPTDPTGGLILDFDAMGDPVMAGTEGGEEVPFYGDLYDTLYLSSQGWISYGEEGTAPTTLGSHFSTAQISVLPVDATVDGSMVSYLQDDEKLVVTYEDVPGAAKAGLNTFQVELFFNGFIRINYVDIDPLVTGIVGLSFGGTVYQREFVPSILSNTPVAKVAI